nr:hypothetical protein [Corynebacterium lactis]
MSSTMPVWGAVALALGVALITQVGALVLWFLQHRHEARQKSAEEWHRNLRWAADHVASDDDFANLLGINALDALDDKGKLSESDQRFIDAILATIPTNMDLPDAPADNIGSDLSDREDYTEVTQTANDSDGEQKEARRK